MQERVVQEGRPRPKTPEFTNFTSLVNEKIKYGWIPQGGIIIHDDTYHQTMIKYND